MSRKLLDDTDLKILDSLAKDARQPLTQLAKDVGVSRPTAISRLNRLISNELLSITSELNLTKLGFRVACASLEVKGPESRKQLEQYLSLCPRVIKAFQLTEKANFSILVYGEDQRTLWATVESLRDFEDTEIIDVKYFEPIKTSDTFALKVYPKKRDVTPCGRICGDCFRYHEGRCIGCPAVVEYTGPL